MSAYKQQVIKLADEIGATLESGKTTYTFEITAEAPKGHHWKHGMHEIVCSSDKSSNKMWESVLEDMQAGIVKCDSDCEWWEE